MTTTRIDEACWELPPPHGMPGSTSSRDAMCACGPDGSHRMERDTPYAPPQPATIECTCTCVCRCRAFTSIPLPGNAASQR